MRPAAGGAVGKSLLNSQEPLLLMMAEAAEHQQRVEVVEETTTGWESGSTCGPNAASRGCLKLGPPANV